ncbi:helix-turn-helix domain-containing protein [Lacipirellula sp.]|uniref:helix-turn-helix domain-containing protein n=1 Tax=Lacipirellula sp. TaxID=2691419 RepID=UPI003D0EDF06
MTSESLELRAPLLISRVEAAKLLAVSPRTVSNLAQAGFLRPIKIGRAVRFDHTQVVVFAQLGTGGGGA